MQTNPAFRTADRDTNLAFARQRGFGVLMVNGPDGPLVSHRPFVLTEDGLTAELHLTRSNPIARAATDPGGDRRDRTGRLWVARLVWRRGSGANLERCRGASARNTFGAGCRRKAPGALWCSALSCRTPGSRRARHRRADAGNAVGIGLQRVSVCMLQLPALTSVIDFRRS
jgi:Putative FMN-binding domain